MMTPRHIRKLLEAALFADDGVVLSVRRSKTVKGYDVYLAINKLPPANQEFTWLEQLQDCLIAIDQHPELSVCWEHRGDLEFTVVAPHQTVDYTAVCVKYTPLLVQLPLRWGETPA